MLASAGGHPSNSHWLVSIPSPKYHGLPHSVSSHHSTTICLTHYHQSLPLEKTLLPHCHSLSLSTLRLPQISSSPPLMVLCHLTVCHDSRKVQDRPLHIPLSSIYSTREVWYSLNMAPLNLSSKIC